MSERDDVYAILNRIESQLASLATSSKVQPEWMSPADAAIYSGLSIDSIRRLIYAGKVSGRRPVAGRLVINRRELDDYVRSSDGPSATGRKK